MNVSGAIQQVSTSLDPNEGRPGQEPRDWFSAGELADLALPGLPADKSRINRRAREERWLLRMDAEGLPLCRPRAGQGGGTEFHVSLLPAAARLELARRGLCSERPAPAIAEPPSAAAWRWFEAQSDKIKAEAARRLTIVAEVELLRAAQVSGTAAVNDVAARHGVGGSTIWSWIAMIEGVALSDRLPALAPRRKGGGKEAEIDTVIWQLFRSDYLRPECPTLASCHARCAAKAAEMGLSMPSQATLRRRLEREVPAEVIRFRREGAEAVRRALPAQRRSVDELHALELVNIDGHKFDVFVTPKAGGKPMRPIMVAIQDVRSSKIVAWRLGEVESAVLTRLAFADLFRDFGIPKGCLLDNGRAFASKWITGGAKTRFRFKIRAEEPTGVLTALGIAIHWALPYRGQSKPIERAFRDLCDSVARHPAVAGAYVGNNPMAKPENYGSRAIEWDAFVAHVARGVAAHNAKAGRRGRDYRGRSFDAVFAESYGSAPIGKATPEQLRMALLAAEQVKVSRQNGEISLFGNRYWSEACGQLHGQRVTVRFDPDNLMGEIHLYDLAGRYLTSAGIIHDSGFLTAEDAQASAKFVANQRRRIRDAAEAEQLLDAHEVARMQAGAPVFDLPEPAAIRPVRHRGHSAAARKIEIAPALPTEGSKVLQLFGRVRPED